MTRMEFVALANRKAIVQWDQSKRYERLEQRKGRIYAIRVTPKGLREHEIELHDNDYFCREVDPAELVRLADLLK